jgi:hypothetical protein
MTTLIAVYHSGTMITKETGSYEFIGKKKENFMLNEFPTLDTLVSLVRKRLVGRIRILMSGWNVGLM